MNAMKNLKSNKKKKTGVESGVTLEWMARKGF